MPIPFFYNTSEKKCTAIIIVPLPGCQQQGKKYQHIENTQAGILTFIAFAKRKFRTATHVNFYGKKTGSYIDRIELE